MKYKVRYFSMALHYDKEGYWVKANSIKQEFLLTPFLVMPYGDGGAYWLRQQHGLGNFFKPF